MQLPIDRKWGKLRLLMLGLRPKSRSPGAHREIARDTRDAKSRESIKNLSSRTAWMHKGASAFVKMAPNGAPREAAFLRL